MGLLDERVVVITGGGRGIGAATAELFACEGALVVVNDLGTSVDGVGADDEPVTRVVSAITRAGGEAIANTGDVAESAAANSLMEQAIDTYGRLDVVVNAAGILRDRMIFNMTDEEWDSVIRVHLRGSFCIARAAATRWRQMRADDPHRRLINFTSVSGLYGAAGQPNYAAAKMGVLGLTYSCANALVKYGATANMISPGANTRMASTIPSDRWDPSLDEEDHAPEHVAPAVAYIASVRSDWLNGHIIGAEGRKVSLLSRPHDLSSLFAEAAWSTENLADALERDFRPLVDAMGSH